MSFFTASLQEKLQIIETLPTKHLFPAVCSLSHNICSTSVLNNLCCTIRARTKHLTS